jgi:hypothetical protein
MPELMDCMSLSVSQGFMRKRKIVPLVDRGNRRIEIGLSGKNHADRVGRYLVHLGKEARAVHLRHAHVGHHDGERPFRFDQREPCGCTDRGFQIETIAQLPPDTVEHVGLVIDEQDAIAHGHEGDPCTVAAQVSRHSFQRSVRFWESRYARFNPSSGRTRVGDVGAVARGGRPRARCRQPELRFGACEGSS